MLVFCTCYHQIYIYIMTPTMYFVEFITFNHCIHHIPNLIKDSLKISVVTFKIHAFVTCHAQTVYLLCWHYAQCFYHPIMLQIMLA